MKKKIILCIIFGIIIFYEIRLFSSRPIPVPLGVLTRAGVDIVFPIPEKDLNRIITHQTNNEVYIEALFFDKNNKPITNANVSVIATDGTYSKRFNGGPYTVDYFATSSGTHTVQFFMEDPDAPKGSNSWVTKSIEFQVE